MADTLITDRKWWITQEAKTVVSSSQPGSTPTTYVSKSSYQSLLFKQGVKNPKYREQIRRGENAATPYTRTSLHQKYRQWSGTGRWLNGSFLVTRTFSGTKLEGGPLSNPASVTTADQRARIKFYSNLGKALRDAEGLTALAEFRQTMQLLRHPFKVLRQAVASRPAAMIDIVRRARHRRAAERALADSWLEFSFGAVPLYNDIVDATKALASLYETPRRVTVTGKGGDELAYRSPSTLKTVGNSMYYTGWYTLQNNAVVNYKAGLATDLYCSVDADTLQKVEQVTDRLGLTANQFIPTLYEIMPWSFLIDYFSTLGVVVNAWASSGTKLAWVVRSEKVVNTTSYDGVWNSPMSGVVGGHVFKDVRFARSIPAGVSIPDLRFESNLSPWKMMNLVALRRAATQQLARVVQGKGW